MTWGGALSRSHAAAVALEVTQRAQEPCRCVYPDKCFCEKEEKRMTARELEEELHELVSDPRDERPVVTSDGKHVTLVTRYEDAIVLRVEDV